MGIEHTVIASAPLVPEIRLHLITETCPLWHASASQAAAHLIGEKIDQSSVLSPVSNA